MRRTVNMMELQEGTHSRLAIPKEVRKRERTRIITVVIYPKSPRDKLSESDLPESSLLDCSNQSFRQTRTKLKQV